MAQSVRLKKFEVGAEVAGTYGVGTTRDGTPAGLGSALHKDGDVGVDGTDELEAEINALFDEELAAGGDIDADGMDELEAEMNAAFEKEFAGDGDDDGEVVEEAQPERNGKGWLR